MECTVQWVEEGRKDRQKEERVQTDRDTDCWGTWTLDLEHDWSIGESLESKKERWSEMKSCEGCNLILFSQQLISLALCHSLLSINSSDASGFLKSPLSHHQSSFH